MTSLAKFWFVVVVAGLTSVCASRAETAKSKTDVAAQKQASCPIAMEARQVAGVASPKEVEVPSKAQVARPAQRIQFTLTNAKLGAIAAVRLRVNGWNGTAHNMPLTKAGAGETRSSKTMDVKVSIGPRKTAETDVWVHGLTGVKSVDLMSVKYADGASWKTPNPVACSVVPDPTMLISQR
jgi:hypothetical protein